VVLELAFVLPLLVSGLYVHCPQLASVTVCGFRDDVVDSQFCVC
jgi:hypothetical protein